MPSSPVSDDPLINRARDGDPVALERLLERHQAQIFRFGLGMCGQRDDAEDVLQDSLLAAARSIRKFRGESSLSTWLFTIARRFCIKKRRRSKYLKGEESLESNDTVRRLPAAGPSPDTAAATAEIRRVIESAMQQLDAPHREVLLLRDVEGLTAKEVAAVMGIRIEAVKSRLHRARASLRQQVAPLLGVPVYDSAAGGHPSSCPDIESLFSRYLEGEIEPGVCQAMERHLVTCPGCRATCDSLKQTLALCRAENPVPPEVQESVRQALRRFLVSAKPPNRSPRSN